VLEGDDPSSENAAGGHRMSSVGSVHLQPFFQGERIMAKKKAKKKAKKRGKRKKKK
jgi:hypothetical protein